MGQEACQISLIPHQCNMISIQTNDFTCIYFSNSNFSCSIHTVIVSQEWYGFICNKSRPSMGRFDIIHIFPYKYYISYYHSHYVAVGILKRLITYSGFDSVFHRYLIYAINSLIIDSIHILMCDSLNDISTSGYISRRHTAYFLIWSNKGNWNGKNDEN